MCAQSASEDVEIGGVVVFVVCWLQNQYCARGLGYSGYEPTSKPSISAVPNGRSAISILPGGPNKFQSMPANPLAWACVDNEI